MNNSKITTRYAKALFELGKETNKTDKFYEDLVLVNSLFQLKDFVHFLNSPIINPSKKKEVFETLLKNKTDDLTLSFLKLVVENQREAFLKIMILDYFKFYREFKGIAQVDLITAVEISNKEKDEFVALLKQVLNKNIELQNNVNKDIIGGFILRIEDKMLDLSVSSQLKQIKKQLSN